MNEIINKITNNYNALVGGVGTLLFALFGKYWIIFALFLFLNIIDWLTGWMKSRLNKKESSTSGLLGIIKKLGYWVMIAFAFGLVIALIEIGNILDIDLSFVSMMGWFVVASLTVNEARSILENFVEAGFDVPKVLVKGLEVTDKMINREECLDEDTIN